MEKRARGEIRVRERSDGRLNYSIRFRAGGRRYSVSLGTDRDGWTYRKAERKVEDVLAQVRAAAARGQPLTRQDGQRQVPLSNESINTTLVLLANVVDATVERGGLETNPARASAAGSKRPARSEGCSSPMSWSSCSPRPATWTGADGVTGRSAAAR